MSEPRRLNQEGSSDLELELLRSARFDAPSPNSRRRALVALGIGTATTTAAVVTGSSTAAAAVATATSTTLIAKWIVGGVIASAFAVGTVTAVTRGPSEPAPRAKPTTAAASVAAPQAAPSAERLAPASVVATVPAPVVSASPSAVAEAPAVAPVATAGPVAAPTAASSSTLGEEVASVDGARSALASGDAAGALRAVDDHDRRFPRGVLGPEATVVRIEALAARGDRASATSLASSFLAAHPKSPHANRLRTLLGLPSPL